MVGAWKVRSSRTSVPLADCTKIKGLRWQYVTVVDSHVVAKPSFQGFDEVESDRELGKLMTGANLEPL